MMPRDHISFIHYEKYPTPLDNKRARIKRIAGYTALFAIMAAMGVMLGYSV